MAVFAGTEFSTAGLLNADAVDTVTLTSPGALATATVAGSPYPITPSAATGTGLGNYTITYVDGELTVTQATAVIVVTGYSVVYDALPHTATGTATGVLGEDLSAGLDLTATTHTAVGASTDPWTFTDPAGNYAPDAGTVDTEITPAPLTVTADDRTKTYGQTVVFAGTEFTTSGLLGADSVDSVTLTSAGAAPTATVAGSPYAITPSAATGTGPRQLHDHLCRRRADGHEGADDDQGQRPDQDLRPDGRVRRHRVHHRAACSTPTP